MTKYLFIESRDPYESVDSAKFLDLVQGVRKGGGEATLFLIQNGVLTTRRGADYSDRYRKLSLAGIAVLADAFSLRERAIDKLTEGVQSAEITHLVDLLFEPGMKAMWH